MAKHKLKQKKLDKKQFWAMDYLYVPEGYVPTPHALPESSNLWWLGIVHWNWHEARFDRVIRFDTHPYPYSDDFVAYSVPV